MEKYKHYLIIDMTNGENCIFEGSSFEETLKVARALTPSGCDLLEIWGTNEDIETFITFGKLYKRDIRNEWEEIGGKVTPETLPARLKEFLDLDPSVICRGLKLEAHGNNRSVYETFMDDDTRANIKTALSDLQEMADGGIQWRNLYILLAMAARPEWRKDSK